jgi:hypothetical protein
MSSVPRPAANGTGPAAKARIPQPLTPATARLRTAARAAARACRSAVTRRRPPRFVLDETRARSFLYRALRRRAGDLGDGEGDGASPSETWGLAPGWTWPRSSAKTLATQRTSWTRPSRPE